MRAGKYQQGIQLEQKDESFKLYGSYSKALACLWDLSLG